MPKEKKRKRGRKEIQNGVEGEVVPPPHKKSILGSNALCPARSIKKTANLISQNTILYIKIKEEDIETDCEDENSNNCEDNRVNSVQVEKSRFKPNGCNGEKYQNMASKFADVEQAHFAIVDKIGAAASINNNMSSRVKKDVGSGYEAFDFVSDKIDLAKTPLADVEQAHFSIVDKIGAAASMNNNISSRVKKDVGSRYEAFDFVSDKRDLVKTPPKLYPSLSSEEKETAKYLNLNLDFGIEEITDYLSNFTTKYHINNNFKLFSMRNDLFGEANICSKTNSSLNVSSSCPKSSFLDSNILVIAPIRSVSSTSNSIATPPNEPSLTKLKLIIDSCNILEKKHNLENNEKSLPPVKKAKLKPTDSSSTPRLPLDTLHTSDSSKSAITSPRVTACSKNRTSVSPNSAITRPKDTVFSKTSVLPLNTQHPSTSSKSVITSPRDAGCSGIQTLPLKTVHTSASSKSAFTSPRVTACSMIRTSVSPNSSITRPKGTVCSKTSVLPLNIQHPSSSSKSVNTSPRDAGCSGIQTPLDTLHTSASSKSAISNPRVTACSMIQTPVSPNSEITRLKGTVCSKTSVLPLHTQHPSASSKSVITSPRDAGYSGIQPFPVDTKHASVFSKSASTSLRDTCSKIRTLPLDTQQTTVTSVSAITIPRDTSCSRIPTMPFDTQHTPVPSKSEIPLIQNKCQRDPRLRKYLTPTISNMQKGRAQPINCKPTTSTTTSAVANPVATAPQEISSRNSTSLAKQIFPSRRDSSSEVGQYTSYPAQDIFFHIIKWDTYWMNVYKIQEKHHPPILGQIEITSVKNTYASKDEYSNTYFKLHLLSIWCDICSSWKNKPQKYQCQFESFEEKNMYFKNMCTQTVAMCDIPIQQSVILVTYKTSDGREQCVFGYVYDVKTRSAPEQNTCKSSPSLRDVLFSFYTDKKIQIRIKGTITIQKLTRVRVVIKQYDALVFGKNSDLKSVVFNPESNARKICKITLPVFSHCSLFALEKYIDITVKSCMSSTTLVTLVQKQHGHDTWLVILALINRLMAHSTIMICLKDTEKLHKIAGNMKINQDDYSVLAVKESEVNVAEDFQQCTLRARATKLRTKDRSLEKAEAEVLKSSKIILTVLPYIFLGETKTLDPKTVLIIDEAHMATEAETALALDLSPKNVILLGDSSERPQLVPCLKRLGYHNTLYHRLILYPEK